MLPSKPSHGGYPGNVGPPAKRSNDILLEFMPKQDWHAIESAARSRDASTADFWRARAGYGPSAFC